MPGLRAPHRQHVVFPYISGAWHELYKRHASPLHFAAARPANTVACWRFEPI